MVNRMQVPTMCINIYDDAFPLRKREIDIHKGFTDEISQIRNEVEREKKKTDRSSTHEKNGMKQSHKTD